MLNSPRLQRSKKSRLTGSRFINVQVIADPQSDFSVGVRLERIGKCMGAEEMKQGEQGNESQGGRRRDRELEARGVREGSPGKKQEDV